MAIRNNTRIISASLYCEKPITSEIRCHHHVETEVSILILTNKPSLSWQYKENVGGRSRSKTSSWRSSSASDWRASRAGRWFSRFLLLVGDRNGNMLVASELMICWIETAPSCGPGCRSPSTHGWRHADLPPFEYSAPNPQCLAASIMKTAKSRHDPLPFVSVSHGSWTPGSSL